MANQIQVTVLGIGSNIIKGDPITLSFPTHLISVQASSQSLTGINGVNSQINYFPNPNSQSQTQKILVSETVSAIATLASTDMFAATIYSIDTFPENGGLDMLFPAVAPSIGTSSGTNINSYINFKGKNYYASETANALVTAANTGGSGGNTIYTGDGSLSGDRVVDGNGHAIAFNNQKYFSVFSVVDGDAGEYSTFGFTARNRTGDNNTSFLTSESHDDNVFVNVQTIFNDGVKGTSILQTSNATASSISYTADTHTFNGDMDYNGNAKLLADRTVDLNAHSLTLSDGYFSYVLDPVSGTITFNFGTAPTQLILSGADNQIDFHSNGGQGFVIGTDRGGYILDAGTGGTASYIADTHTFNVGMTITELAGVGTRAIAVDATGKIVLL